MKTVWYKTSNFFTLITSVSYSCPFPHLHIFPGVQPVAKNCLIPVSSIRTARVVKIIPIKRSMATGPRSPRKRLRPLERKIMIPEQNQDTKSQVVDKLK